jgi:hypothetical protein
MEHLSGIDVIGSQAKDRFERVIKGNPLETERIQAGGPDASTERPVQQRPYFRRLPLRLPTHVTAARASTTAQPLDWRRASRVAFAAQPADLAIVSSSPVLPSGHRMARQSLHYGLTIFAHVRSPHAISALLIDATAGNHINLLAAKRFSVRIPNADRFGAILVDHRMGSRAVAPSSRCDEQQRFSSAAARRKRATTIRISQQPRRSHASPASTKLGALAPTAVPMQDWRG